MQRGGNKWTKLRRAMQSLQLPVIITFSFLIFLVLLIYDNGEKPASPFVLKTDKWNSFDFVVQSDPTVELRNKTDVIWQIPSSPKAVLFLAHGCNGRAANFWDKSPKCTHCVGLPEERLIVLQALAQKFAVLAISSVGRCWSLQKERLAVRDIIKWWVKRHKLEKLPLVALGASSGGYFVSALANDVKFNSVAIMIAEGVFGHMEIKKDYPPTIFVHMPKDETRSQNVIENMEMLSDKGIHVSEVKCMEFPLSPNFLADRIPGLDQRISVELFNLFRHKGFIDTNGFMKKDGRATPWKEALKERNIILPDKNLVNHIQEELNLAFAYHEMTSLQSNKIFAWFESHMS